MKSATIGRWLLGTFILWQLWYITTSNFNAYLGDGPVQAAMHTANQGWAEAACQNQGWRQYSPSITRQSVFPAVEIWWADGTAPIELRSLLEPSDPLDYWQTPVTARLGFYEGTLDWQMWGWNYQSIAAEPERYQRQMAMHLRGCWRSIRAYLHWSWQHFQRNHLTAPSPDALVFRLRLYAMPAPDASPWRWGEPEDLPVAVWRPALIPPAGALPIEMFDPQAKAFVPLLERDGND